MKVCVFAIFLAVASEDVCDDNAGMSLLQARETSRSVRCTDVWTHLTHVKEDKKAKKALIDQIDSNRGALEQKRMEDTTQLINERDAAVAAAENTIDEKNLEMESATKNMLVEIDAAREELRQAIEKAEKKAQTIHENAKHVIAEAHQATKDAKATFATRTDEVNDKYETDSADLQQERDTAVTEYESIVALQGHAEAKVQRAEAAKTELDAATEARSQAKAALPSSSYAITIKTSGKLWAGTDCNIYVQIGDDKYGFTDKQTEKLGGNDRGDTFSTTIAWREPTSSLVTLGMENCAQKNQGWHVEYMSVDKTKVFEDKFLDNDCRKGYSKKNARKCAQYHQTRYSPLQKYLAAMNTERIKQDAYNTASCA